MTAKGGSALLCCVLLCISGGPAAGCAEEELPIRAGETSLAVGDSCRSDVAIRELEVRPAVITPVDSNGVFDRASIGFDVAVDPGRGACVLERVQFNFFAAWSVDILSPAGEVVREFSGREVLDFGLFAESRAA